MSTTSHIYILSCLQHPASVSRFCPVSPTFHFCIYILSCLQHTTSVSTFCPVSNIPLLYLHFVLSPPSHFCIYILSCLHHPTSMSLFCPFPPIPLLRRIPLCPLSPPPPPFLHCFEQFRLHSQIQRLWDSLYVYDADCVGLLFDDSAKALSPRPPLSIRPGYRH
jgi:hypothetical protein